MDSSSKAVVTFLALVAGTMIIAPALAWMVWWRRPKPRPGLLLVLAIVATAPLVSGIGGTIAAATLLRSSSNADPSQKARLLGEAISEAMNVTALASIATIVVAGGIIAARMIRRQPKG